MLKNTPLPSSHLTEMPFCAVTVRSKGFDRLVNSKWWTVNSQKIAKKSEILWDRRYSREQGACKFWHSLDIPAARVKRKTLKCTLWAVNYKKNSKKIQKIWNFWHQRGWGAQGVCNFFAFRHCRSSWRKKQNLAQKKTLKNALFCFFARAPRMSFDHKNLQAPCAPKPLWCQKIIFF